MSSYIRNNPILVKEWNYKKNINLDINNYTTGSGKKVWWKCAKGHEWEAQIYSRAKGQGCPICSNRKIVEGINDLATTRPDLLEEWDYEKNNALGIYPTKVHKGSNIKVWWKCKICQNEWFSLIDSKSRGYGCPECGKKRVVEKLIKRKISQNGSVKDSFPEIAKEWHPTKNVDIKPDMISPGSNKKVWWKCAKGHEWEAQINQRCYQKTKCPRCSGNIQKTDEEFKNEIKIKNPNIEILTKYINAKTRLKCKCHICGNTWIVVANHLQQGQGCPKCAQNIRTAKQTMSQKDYEQKISIINPNIEIIGKYISSHNRIKVKCKKCNHIWNPQAWDLVQGNGCPNCSHTSTSYVEKFIYESFKCALGKNSIKSRDKSAIGKELDIYVQNFNFAIEPGSWFWHKDKLDNDIKKIELCKKKGINLIVIYDNYNDSKTIKNPNIITYKIDLSNNRNIKRLRELVIKLLNYNGINKVFTKKEWENISNKAYLSSRQKNTKEFIDELKNVNKNIEVLGEYTGYKNKMLVKCNKCSYEWLSDPGHLLIGRGCPKCQGFYKTHEEFVKQVQKKLPNIMVITEYINTKTRVDVKCNVCGHVWNVKPGNLLSGFGCPVCARKKQSLKQSKPVYQYSLDGKFIKKYNSGKEASEETGASRGGISNVCEGKAKTSGGFIWKYESGDEIK